MRICIIILFFCFNASELAFSQSQNTTSINFNIVYGNEKLNLFDSYHKLSNVDSLVIELLRFYISGIEFLENDKVVWKEENSFHLVDAEINKSLKISLNGYLNIKFDKIKFNLGVDSATNVSGAFGGDLDPTKGMFWTWQSGYINFKVEGKSNLCNTRNNEFQFHLGGYTSPFSNLQTVVLPINKTDQIIIQLDLQKILSSIDLAKQNHIMSPGRDAIILSKYVATCFSILE